MATKRRAKLNEQIGNFIRVHLPKFTDAIKAAEVEAEQQQPRLTGAQKLERAVEVVNGIVNIPFLTEAMEEMLFKTILSAIVEVFNAHFGKGGWLDKV